MAEQPLRARPSRSRSSGVRERPRDDRVALVAASDAMRETLDQARRIADSDVPVVLRGETGVGKELVAEIIHRQSARRWEPMVCLNCATIPTSLVSATLFGHERGSFTGAESQRAGVFEEADGGTLFLDEVAELPAEAQAALLRVLESGRVRRVGATAEIPVDVRVLTATHRDLRQMCDEGRFREDLLYRLDVVTIVVAPLRERRADIVPLARSFLARTTTGAVQRRLSPAAERALVGYRWPGNVRELRNAMERAAVLAASEEVTLADLPPTVRVGAVRGGRPALTLPERLREVERALIEEALDRTGGNRVEAARELGIPRRTLFYKLRRLGLTSGDDD